MVRLLPLPLALSSIVTRRAIGRVFERTGPDATRLNLRSLLSSVVVVVRDGRRALALSERESDARRATGGDFSGRESCGVGGEDPGDLFRDDEPLERRT